MPTRNVVLTEHHEHLIAMLVESGKYQNASEVLRDGLRMVESREAEEAAKLVALRAAADAGIASAQRGDFIGFDDSLSLSAHLNRLGDVAINGEALS